MQIAHIASSVSQPRCFGVHCHKEQGAGRWDNHQFAVGGDELMVRWIEIERVLEPACRPPGRRRVLFVFTQINNVWPQVAFFVVDIRPGVFFLRVCRSGKGNHLAQHQGDRNYQFGDFCEFHCFFPFSQTKSGGRSGYRMTVSPICHARFQRRSLAALFFRGRGRCQHFHQGVLGNRQDHVKFPYAIFVAHNRNGSQFTGHFFPT